MAKKIHISYPPNIIADIQKQTDKTEGAIKKALKQAQTAFSKEFSDDNRQQNNDVYWSYVLIHAKDLLGIAETETKSDSLDRVKQIVATIIENIVDKMAIATSYPWKSTERTFALLLIDLQKAPNNPNLLSAIRRLWSVMGDQKAQAIADKLDIELPARH